MAFTVQNDDGDVADANAYITVEYFEAYHTDLGVTAVVDGEYDETQIQGAIVAATAYIDYRWRHKGRRLNGRDQTTEHPRSCLRDREGYLIEGIAIELKKACAEYALRVLQLGDSTTGALGSLAPDPTFDESGRAIVEKEETVGPITQRVRYEDGATLSQLIKPYPVADLMLRDLVLPSGGGVSR